MTDRFERFGPITHDMITTMRKCHCKRCTNAANELVRVMNHQKGTDMKEFEYETRFNYTAQYVCYNAWDES